MRQLHSALFIDYDNVRTELERYDPAVAARFSNKTLVWLEALEKSMPLPSGVEADGRRIVSRRCYASPHKVNNHRRNFTQTGFEVIDCPPLTAHLKNSADIYIVMDIIDYLQRYPNIEEYIILSADADFVPVLNRLRKELKKSVIFTSYNTTAAYRNCSDRTIEADFFAKYLAVETTAPRASQDIAGKAARQAPPAAVSPASAPPAGNSDVDPQLAAAIAMCLTRAADARLGSVTFAIAAQALREELAAELGSNWAGHRTFAALLDHTNLPGLEVDSKGQVIRNPAFEVDLAGWDEEEREQLGEFVGDVLWCGRAAKHVPLLPPALYCMIFDELAKHYRQNEPGTLAHAINTVSEACRSRGAEVSAQAVRSVATGITMQQYRFSAASDANELAALWRAQVFDLCEEPDWMRETEEADRLAGWFHATGEPLEAARDDFLARTAGEKDVGAGTAEEAA
ncbi:MAG TPA: NYN domain-containing protein [Allosphingosinicella sp.]